MNALIRICRNGVVALLAAMLVAGCADKPEALVASAKEYLGQERSQRGRDPAQDRAAEESRSGRGTVPSGQSRYSRPVILRGRRRNSAGRTNSIIRPTRSFRRLRDVARCARTTQEGARGVRDGGHRHRRRRKADLQTTTRSGADGDRQCRGRRRRLCRRAWPRSRVIRRLLIGEARLKAAGGDLDGSARAGRERHWRSRPALTEGWQLKGDLAGRAASGGDCACGVSQGGRSDTERCCRPLQDRLAAAAGRQDRRSEQAASWR